MHIKIIKGKKYYYESKRIGKKVTSKYIGPVEKIKKNETQKTEEEMSSGEDESYIG